MMRASLIRWTGGALLGATIVMMPVALWAALFYAPHEETMGAVQRIFYFHVPAAMAAYLCVALLLTASIVYLSRRDLAWDDLSRSATEVALLFCTLVLITGPIWAKPAWGAWWTWEARLISTLVLEILLVAALMVRRYAGNRDLGARLAAVLGITIAADVYVVHKAVEWWRGMHPQVFRAGGRGSLDPQMRTALLVCLLAMTLLSVSLVWLRFRTARVESRTEILRLDRTNDGDDR
jgi:heme exporter protein C